MSAPSGKPPEKGEDRFLLTAGWTATILALLCMAAGVAGGVWLIARFFK